MTFCDSSGIATLLAARNHAHAAQAGTALTALPDHTLRVLRIVGLDQVFRLQPTSAARVSPESNRDDDHHSDAPNPSSELKPKP